MHSLTDIVCWPSWVNH